MFSLFTFLITISVVVVFHEWGHYIAARYYGVRVERFSLGFGKVLLKRTDKRGTEWAISMWPLGGYVMPLAEPAPADPNYQVGQSITEKSAWQRIVIYAAGPAFSFLLGILIYTGFNWLGTQEPVAKLAAPQVASVAAVAGVQAGDRLTAVNGRAVESWTQAVEELMEPMTLGQSVELGLENQSGNARVVQLSFERHEGSFEQVNLLQNAGLILQAPKPFFSQILADGPAERAGLQANDIVSSVNGQAIQNATELLNLIRQHPEQALSMVVLREGAPISVVVTPMLFTTDTGEQVGRIQAQIGAQYEEVLVSFGPIQGIVKAVNKTWDTAWFSLRMMGKMLTGEVSIKNISGPVTIADYSGKVASYGIDRFIQFIALISISIGVLNLLPIPGLDGGQMVINFIEMVRQRPLSDEVMGVVSRTGYGLLLLLMVFAFSNDISRLLGLH